MSLWLDTPSGGSPHESSFFGNPQTLNTPTALLALEGLENTVLAEGRASNMPQMPGSAVSLGSGSKHLWALELVVGYSSHCILLLCLVTSEKIVLILSKRLTIAVQVINIRQRIQRRTSQAR